MMNALDTLDRVSLSELHTVLSRLPVDGSHNSIAGNLSLITNLGQPPVILSLISEALENRARLTEIASRSYRHVSHFDKIVLVDSAKQDGYRLTLHFWDPPYTEKELSYEPIHDHRFSFWSTVLVGRLTSENFSLSDDSKDGEHLNQYRYIPEKRDLSTVANFYQFVGKATVSKLGTDISERQAGEAYYMYYERIHRVLLPLERMTCTLVLRGPRQRQHSHVFNTAYPKTDVQLTNVMFTPEQLSGKLTRLAQRIEAARGR